MTTAGGRCRVTDWRLRWSSPAGARVCHRMIITYQAVARWAERAGFYGLCVLSDMDVATLVQPSA